LSFHGTRGRCSTFGLVGVLLVVYTLASQASPLAGGVAALALAGLWPALWRSSLRFRLANTGWSGLRGGFTGSLRDAYLAFWPWLLVPILFIGVTALVPAQGPAAAMAGVWLSLAVVTLALPLGLWTLRRYQHGHCAFGDEHTRFNVTLGSVYRVLALTALIALVALGLPLAGIALATGLAKAGIQPRAMAFTAVLMMVGGLASSFVLFQAVVRPFATARLQNLFWNGTRSQRLRVVSRLRARALIGLSLKNWVLVLLTAGLYLPFAAVATARLRLESVVLLSKAATDDLQAGAALARRRGQRHRR
jgi:uncharacterized membrane protein YjgN (DUF898 family)